MSGPWPPSRAESGESIIQQFQRMEMAGSPGSQAGHFETSIPGIQRNESASPGSHSEASVRIPRKPVPTSRTYQENVAVDFKKTESAESDAATEDLGSRKHVETASVRIPFSESVWLDPNRKSEPATTQEQPPPQDLPFQTPPPNKDFPLEDANYSSDTEDEVEMITLMRKKASKEISDSQYAAAERVSTKILGRMQKIYKRRPSFWLASITAIADVAKLQIQQQKWADAKPTLGELVAAIDAASPSAFAQFPELSADCDYMRAEFCLNTNDLKEAQILCSRALKTRRRLGGKTTDDYHQTLMLKIRILWLEGEEDDADSLLLSLPEKKQLQMENFKPKLPQKLEKGSPLPPRVEDSNEEEWEDVKEPVGKDIPATSENILGPTTDQNERAEEFKEGGNVRMGLKDYLAAVDYYTKAINLVQSAVYYSNRAAAHTALHQYTDAKDDAEIAVQLEPKYAKAWSRLGLAKFHLGDLDGSMGAYSMGMAVEGREASTAMRNGYELAKCQLLAQKQAAETQKDKIPVVPPEPARPAPNFDTIVKVFQAAKTGNLKDHHWQDVIHVSKGKNVQDRTLLSLAVTYGDLSEIELLLNYGINVDETFGPLSRTVLHQAAAESNSKMVEKIIFSHANVMAMDIRGNTMLHIATQAGDLRIVEKIFFTIFRAELQAGSNDTMARMKEFLALRNVAGYEAASYARTPVMIAQFNQWSGKDMQSVPKDLYYYLQPKFNPVNLTVEELRRIFDKHNIPHKNGSNKTELVKIFNDAFKPGSKSF